MPVRIERKSGAGKKVTQVYSKSEVDERINNFPAKLMLESRQHELDMALQNLDASLEDLNETRLPKLETELNTLEGYVNDPTTIPDDWEFFEGVFSPTIVSEKVTAFEAFFDEVFARDIFADKITSNEVKSNSLTANEINVEDLLAQDVTVTGTLTLEGDVFTATGNRFKFGENGFVIGDDVIVIETNEQNNVGAYLDNLDDCIVFLPDGNGFPQMHLILDEGRQKRISLFADEDDWGLLMMIDNTSVFKLGEDGLQIRATPSSSVLTSRAISFIDSNNALMSAIWTSEGGQVIPGTHITAYGSRNIYLTTSGQNRVEVNTGLFRVPTHSDAAIGFTNPINGCIAYDSTNHRFMGYANGSWTQL